MRLSETTGYFGNTHYKLLGHHIHVFIHDGYWENSITLEYHQYKTREEAVLSAIQYWMAVNKRFTPENI